MIRPIKIYPEKVLSRKSKPIGVIDAEIEKLIDDLVETMYAKDGAGLAANQVGELKQIIAINDGGGALVLLNPKILSRRGKIVGAEGCLSLPGFELEVKRPQKILVEYLDKGGREKKIKASNLLARVICHEVEHLQGKTLLDKLPIIKRIITKRKIRKLARKK